MADLLRSTSPPNSTDLSVQEDEGILDEDRSAGGSDGPAHSRASVDAPISAPASPLEETNNENEAATSHPQQTSTSHHPARKATFFGIPQPSGAPANFHPNYDDDYETRFPPDPIYEEASSPNARVYRVYVEESAKYDAYMTDEAREGLDVLLVFAGLFSAVLTTFVAQTSQSLQPDRATESTLLLREIAALQRAQMNGTSVDSIPSTPADFVLSSIDVWVNGLWFTSLTLSLASALFAVLIKQWLRHYMSSISGTPKRRTCIHQYRFMGLQKWHVPTLIGILPVLMHLSLAIFFAGLTLFLAALRSSIASVVGSLSALVFGAYIITATLPLFHPQCPYHTPLTGIIHWLSFIVRKYVLRNNRLAYVRLKFGEHRPSWFSDDLVAHAFLWLLRISANPSVHRVVVQAVSGLSRDSSSSLNTLFSRNFSVSFLSAYQRMFAASFSQSHDGGYIYTERADLLERLFRAALHTSHAAVSPTHKLDDILAACQALSAPTLEWEITATVFLWHHYRDLEYPDDRCIIVAEKACTLLAGCLALKPGNDIRLPAILWEKLLEAAASSPAKVGIPTRPNMMHDKIISKELERRVCYAEWGRSTLLDDWMLPISCEDALCTSDGFVWSLLWPFDDHEENPLDSEKVQRLLCLVNAFTLLGPSQVSRDVFFGTWKQIICEVQASVTRKDQDAICVAADAFLQQRTAFQTTFGPIAVLLPSLAFLHCWTPHITSRSARADVVLTLIEIDVFKALNELESIEGWLWSASSPYSLHLVNNAAPVASLFASVIRTSFESKSVGSVPHQEDPRWFDYFSLPENSAAIVAMFAFQGSTSTPASVAQVRDDLVILFASQSWDCQILQKCRVSLEENLQLLVPEVFRDDYRANVKEARKTIDEFIVQQSPNVNPFSRLLRRSVKGTDPEAIMTQSG